MKNDSYLGNIDIKTIESIFQQYQESPDDVDPLWRKFFEGFEFALNNYSDKESTKGKSAEKMSLEFNVINLINAYRQRGHLFTRTNPVRTRRKYSPTLDLENYNLSSEYLNEIFQAGEEICLGPASLQNIVDHLQETYCSSIGVEYMYIRTPEIVNWLKAKMEVKRNRPEFSGETKLQILKNLTKAVGFEHFVRKRFPGQKRFSLEGCETLIPALDALIEKGASLGASEFVIGMAHRGRLNVLGNTLKKPFHKIFSEFEGKEYADETLLGDVKYHLGCTLEKTTRNNHQVNLSIAPNPSHLEAVTPVVIGLSRAKTENKHQGDSKKLIPVIIHGDSSIAGQGVVYEVIQMSQLEGYKTGGAVHLVINNQLGFTTNYLDARSSTYCTDVAKTIQSPIFHVNGDDVEAVVYTIELAIEFRQKFQRDVFIDLLSYRKYGHNESDEPRFTQPTLYKIIEKHPDPASIYISHLKNQGVLENGTASKMKEEFTSLLEKELEKAKSIKKGSIDPFLEKTWSNFPTHAADLPVDPAPTISDEKTIVDLTTKITSLPEDINFFRKIRRLFSERYKMVIEDQKLDWAMGETLAYATLLNEGISVRVSGQDVERGTFSHRHAVLQIEGTTEEYVPLNHIGPQQAPFMIYNSPLSEFGVLGFEYGYSIASPYHLVIWEAQFGDFMNGAQTIIDQFITSAEEKWKVKSGLVMLLPHGYEGQGPEHSSARIERFLNSCAQNNIQVANCTTPANFFHLLRRQVKGSQRKPLVVFTPKSLLRHPLCISSTSELSNGGFKPLIDDQEASPDNIRRVLLCSGKVYYDLLEEKRKKGFSETAIIRLEQLFPVPVKQLEEIREKYNKAERWLWVQEEPQNMGAWAFLKLNLKTISLSVIARPPSASPASGSSKFHNLQQTKIIEKAFEECDCENVCKECQQLCISELINQK